MRSPSARIRTAGYLMNAPVITSTAPVDNPIRTTTLRPWQRVGGRGSLMSICAASRGARNVASQPSASTRVKQAVTPKARRRAAWRALNCVRSLPASMDIGQQAQEPHPEPPDGVHGGAVARIDHDVRLRADAQGTYLLSNSIRTGIVWGGRIQPLWLLGLGR